MSSVSEIQVLLPHLTVEGLKVLDIALREQWRTRKVGILYDDGCGVWTEEDQISAAAEAFTLLDEGKPGHDPS